MIYIDPPYNTKNNSLIYGDDFSQSNEEVLKTLDYSKEKLDYIKNLFGSKCHSGWLSFMYPRLLLAKDLLKQDGVIFISIDDNECAQLKLLCDEIFGEGNFVSCFVWEKTQHFGRQKLNYYSNSEYVLCYAKNLYDSDKQQRLLIENIQTEFDDAPLYNASNNKHTMTFPKKSCIFNIKDGIYTQSDEQDKYELLNSVIVKNQTNENEFQISFKSRWSNQTLQDELGKGAKVLIKSTKFSPRMIYADNKEFIVSPKTLIFTNDKNPFCAKFKNIKVGTNENGSAEISNLLGKEIFSYPKPTSLLFYLIGISTTPNEGDIILDFFAGSGTTAHAVLESNKSDYQKLSEGGGLFNGLNAALKERRFILVQLDEKIEKNKSAYDFCLNTLKSPSPSIFDITEERIKIAGAKIQEACPDLDVGFRAFEIIDGETHVNDKNLSQAHQKDLFAYSNLEKMETQTILIKLLGCEGLELTTPIICLIENALYLALNTAFIVGDVEMSEVLESLKDKGVEKISMYMPAISNDRLCLELGSNLFDLKLESGDLKIRG